MLTNRREVEIEWGDCDAAGIVFYPRYFAMFDASTAYLMEKALGMKKARWVKAHGIVGTLVAGCEQQNKKLAELTLEEFKQNCSVIEQDVYEHLGPGNVVNKYVTDGAAGPKQVKEQVEYWNKRLAER